MANLPRFTLDGAPLTAAATGDTARGGPPGGYTTGAFVAGPYTTEETRSATAFASPNETAAGQDPGASEIAGRLSEGMSVDDVTACLGMPSSRATVGSGGRAITRCTWRLADGSTLACRFSTKGLTKWEVE